MSSDSRRLMVSIDVDTDTAIRQAAADHATTPGLVARALIIDGLQRLDTEPVQTAISDVVAVDRQRRAAVGRQVMAARYQQRDKE